ncbi:hypothetical protein AVEN_206676-1 [Araneus ventricosus]|uniref:Uncharacterized protein n=1 Tax=Araneus ventricosus TaxID=182803 RepID=A0A4Y2VVW8_ARAVE|nr:hypothetical protein AVEN_206676-1 [Araneus ventricosus]
MKRQNRSRSTGIGACARDSRIICDTGNTCKKSMRVQGTVGLRVSLGPPAASSVGETLWQSPTADRLLAVVGTCASFNCSRYSTNLCVCKEP